MYFSVLRVAALVFCSGMCALTYQTVWMRELRLIFGASTPASAAVLAIFMGGLGVGGILLGRRAEAHRRPLLFYAHLELLIALAAAATPVLLWLVRALYVGLGGTGALGLTLGTAVRLLLAALVLGVPTVLMGGTLPAAARAVETDDDARRSNLAVLYGLNTLGAVCGAALSTFVLLESLGNHLTLWLLCAANVGVAYLARRMALGMPEVPVPVPMLESLPESVPAAPVGLVLISAAIAGMAFLLMELVFYRMLAPLLGGSTFTFGLILAVALLGIGLGGVAYSLWNKGSPATLAGFATSCILEALFLALPLYLGDRIAMLALFLQPLGALGFLGHVLGWTHITVLVVLPAAFVSGIQFPLLLGLMGRGREQVGRQVGLLYAWNTAGAIVGSLLGGFGLIPLLSAPGTWRLATGLLVALGIVAAFFSLRQQAPAPAQGPPALPLLPLMGALLTTVFLFAPGPTALWRHGAIGVGRANLPDVSPSRIHDWRNSRLRSVLWEQDGVESSVAVLRDNSLAFMVNGKVDGNAVGDAATQVMGGLIGALLHPQPRRALVIGLGTGSTAGWLGAIPDMEWVDVAEIEPAILRVARDCAQVNQHVLDNPRVHVTIGDAREVLLTTQKRYDIIFSEPSNPYRAGIASLYTREFYRAAASRLAPSGVFLQWLQAYEIDNTTIRSIYATLASVFPQVETWMTTDGDLVLMSALQPIRYDVDALRRRVREEPYRTALLQAWRVTSVEGVLAHFVARTQLAQAMAATRPPLNTDDRTKVEFGFARSVGQNELFDLDELLELAHRRGEDRQEVSGGAVDWDLVGRQRVALFTAVEKRPPGLSFWNPSQRSWAALQRSYIDGSPEQALQTLQGLKEEPADVTETSVMADLLSYLPEGAAPVYIERLRQVQPTEAAAITARWLSRSGKLPEAAAQLESAFLRYRSDPWASRLVMRRALGLARDLAATDRSVAERLYQALEKPFAVYNLDEDRLSTLVAVVEGLGMPSHCRSVLDAMEPHVPWRRQFLIWRLNCYRLLRDPRAYRAESDLASFLSQERVPLQQQLEPSGAPAHKGP